jgi:hypothetical protein
MSDFDYKEGDEFEVSPKEGSKIALKILAKGGTYKLDGNIIKITSLPEDKSKKVEAKAKVEEKKAEVEAKVEEKKAEVETKKAEEPKAKPVAAPKAAEAKTEDKE